MARNGKNDYRLTLASYNVQGLNTAKWPYVRNIFDRCDFLLLQETWLHDSQSHLFADNLKNVNYHCVSGMEPGVLIQGRPHGGCCIAWHNSIACSVTPVHTHSRRSCAVKIAAETHTILLCTVYMPCDTSYDVDNQAIFDDTLNELLSIADIEDVTSIIIGGDLNTDMSRQNSLHTVSVERFVSAADLILLNNLPCYAVDYTYESVMNHAKSTIDHFVVSSGIADAVLSVECEHKVENLSDHSVLFFTAQIPTRRVAERTRSPSSQKPLWHKASPPDIEQYQDYLDASLNAIPAPFAAFSCTDQWCTTHRDDLESFYETLVEMSIAAERCCIPHSSPRVSNHQIPGWDRFIKPLKRDACFWHAIWKSCGSPAQGTVAGIRRSTRSRYHRAIRALKRNEELVRFAEMGDRFLQDERNGFWTEVKKIKGQSSCTPSMVDGKCTEEEIADAFSTKYQELYNSVGYDPHGMEALTDEVNHSVFHHHSDCSSHNVTYADVVESVSALKRGKHDGNLGQYSDHLIHGSRRFLCHLALCLNSLLSHNIVPQNMLLSTVSPIPKDKRKSMNDSNNYRGIALSCVVGKLLDKIILRKCQALVDTSYQQFGFKKSHSTVQ